MCPVRPLESFTLIVTEKVSGTHRGSSKKDASAGGESEPSSQWQPTHQAAARPLITDIASLVDELDTDVDDAPGVSGFSGVRRLLTMENSPGCETQG